MPVSVPDFIGLLQNYARFEQAVEYAAYRATVVHGLAPSFDYSSLKNVHADWREAVVSWDGKKKKFGDVSHIKMAGFLLWAFNEQENPPITGCLPLTERDSEKISGFGLTSKVREFNKDKALVLRAFPSQSVGYIFTTAVFNAKQRGRSFHAKLEARIDFDNPPLTNHYFQNICWYMFDLFPKKESLYLIFKTMDLYGFKLPIGDLETVI